MKALFWRCLWCDARALLERDQEVPAKCPACEMRGVIGIVTDEEIEEAQ